MAPLVWMAVLMSAGGAAAHHAHDPQARRTLVWIDYSGGAGVPDGLVAAEARRLLAEVGLEVGWRRGKPSAVLRAQEVPVIVLPRDRARRPSAARVLGACRPTRAGGLWIYMDNLRWALDLPPGPLGARDTARLARALGRIVAHEAIHFAAPELEHAPSGLMSAQLGRGELLGSDLGVDAATRLAFLSRRSQRASAVPPTS